MKRAKELRKLSSDHHRALVFSKKAKRAQSDAESLISAIWEEIEQYYSTELDNHFQIEEEYIAVHLAARGRNDLSGQLYREHQNIRAFFSPDFKRSASELHELGKLLEQHVRFEERELFNVAQELLSSKDLKALLEKCSE